MSDASPKSPKEEFGSRFWWIREDDQIRGPYTGNQMLAFLLKGRLKADSQVRPDTETEWRAASEEPVFARYFESGVVQGEPAARQERPRARHRMPNFVIMVDGDAYPETRIEAVIGELGAHYRLMPHIWLLHCSLQVEKIRTYLVRHLGDIRRLFIVDVHHGTYAFHRFEDQVEDRIRDLLKPREEAED